MTPIREQFGRAPRGIRLVTFRAILAAGASLAWLCVAPARATTSATVASTTPTNLLQGDNATFSASSGTWANYSDVTLQWAPTSGEGASGGLALTATGPKMTVLSGTSGNGGLTPASPGSIYSAGVSAVAPSGAEQMQSALVFYSGTGTLINAIFGPASKVGTSSWSQVAPAVAIAPANATSVVLGVVVYNTAAGSTAVLDNAWIEQTAAASTPAVVGPLSTSGNEILQANGTPFVPRGVVLNGLESNPNASTVTQEAVVQAKIWGANIVRVPLGEQYWLSSNCDYSPGYQATVNQVVTWITSLGMVALLDLHTNTVLGCQGGAAHNMADEAQSPTFWSQVATQYASNPLVAFDLYNEPHGISNQVWLNGGMTLDTYTPYLLYQAAGMQQLYNNVRTAGAQNLVFISGPNWANDPPSQLVNGMNIVYAAHAYTCPNSPPPSCSWPTPYDASSILQPWVSFSASQPVAVTEFGWPSQSDGTYAANLIAYARAEGWGWIAFAWEDSHDPAAWDITTRWLTGIPAEPAPSGIPVLCELVRASNGTSPCVAPTTSAPSSPTTQTASPSAPASKSTPTAKLPVRVAPVQPGLVPAAGTTVGALGSGPARGARAACVSACLGSRTTAGIVGTTQGSAEWSGRAGSIPLSGHLRLAGVFAVIGLFMFGPLPRRLRVLAKGIRPPRAAATDS